MTDKLMHAVRFSTQKHTDAVEELTPEERSALMRLMRPAVRAELAARYHPVTEYPWNWNVGVPFARPA